MEVVVNLLMSCDIIYSLLVCLNLPFCVLITDKVFDAVEVSGKNVMSTTSVVTTKLVSQK